MNFDIKPSFERIYKKLPHSEKARIDEKVRELFDYYNKEVLFAGPTGEGVTGPWSFVRQRRFVMRDSFRGNIGSISHG